MSTSSIRTTALLLSLAVLAVGGTVLWQQFTTARITAAEQQLKAQRWLSVLAQQAYDNQPLQQPLTLGATNLDHSRLLAGYLATLKGQPSAVVLHSQSQGYGGPLDLLIAIDEGGRLIGVKVLQQQETPGLGGKLMEPATPGCKALSATAGKTRLIQPGRSSVTTASSISWPVPPSLPRRHSSHPRCPALFRRASPTVAKRRCG